MDRLEDILLRLAQQYAPHILRAWNPLDPQRVAKLARYLASYNVLVIMGDFPQTLRIVEEDSARQIQAWVDSYAQFYLLLARALFPSFVGISAQYADNRWPVAIAIRGECAPVIEAMAGFVTPYIAMRQTEAVVSEIELIGLMEVILEVLEGTTLPREAYRRLLSEGAGLLKKLLASPIRQHPITNFDRRVFTDSERFIPIPPEPGKLPEEDSALLFATDTQETRPDVTSLKPEQAAFNPPTDTQTLPPTETLQTDDRQQPPETGARPVSPPFFLPRREEGRRRPPVPPLPGKDEDKG